MINIITYHRHWILFIIIDKIIATRNRCHRPQEICAFAFQQTNYTRSRMSRYFESVGGDLESTTEHERSYISNTIIMCVLKSCNWLPDCPPSPPCYMPCRHGGALPPQSSITAWRGFC